VCSTRRADRLSPEWLRAQRGFPLPRQLSVSEDAVEAFRRAPSSSRNRPRPWPTPETAFPRLSKFEAARTAKNTGSSGAIKQAFRTCKLPVFVLFAYATFYYKAHYEGDGHIDKKSSAAMDIRTWPMVIIASLLTGPSRSARLAWPSRSTSRTPPPLPPSPHHTAAKRHHGTKRKRARAIAPGSDDGATAQKKDS